MKTKSAFILIVLVLGLALPTMGQDAQDAKTKTDPKRNVMSGMAASPVFETTSSGIHLKVWIVSNDEALKNDELNTEETTGEEAASGTHRVMIEAKDAESGKDVSATTAKILVKSPSNKSTTVDLRPKMDELAGSLNLTEKGEYQLTVSINANGKSCTTPFKYIVK